MYKIDLRNYSVEIPGHDEAGNPAIFYQEYDVKTSLVTCCMHPDLQLGASELLKRDEVARKIRDSEFEVLLEDSDFAILRSSFDVIKGLTQNDVELVKRVFSAGQIEVIEK